MLNNFTKHIALLFVFPLLIGISDLSASCIVLGFTPGVQTPCNPVSNQYDQEVTIFYSDAPLSGSLVVNGLSFPITGSPQTVMLSNLPANGGVVALSAFFSAEVGCSLTIPSAFVAPVSCCNNIRITEVDPTINFMTLKNFGSCAVDVSDYRLSSHIFTTPDLNSLTLLSGSFNLAPGASLSLTTFLINENGSDLALYKPYGSFTDPDAMVDFVQWVNGGNVRESVAVSKGIWLPGTFVPAPGPFEYVGDGVQNGAAYWQGTCLVTAVSPFPITNCDSVADTYDQEVLIQYQGAFGLSDLLVNGTVFPVTGSPQTVSLTDLPADHQTYDLFVSFTQVPGCFSFESDAFTAPYSCVPCVDPSAAFTLSRNFLTIETSNTSVTKGPGSWWWDFGDGNTSMDENPVHTYDSAGIYDVCLVTMDSCGNDTFCINGVEACEPPVPSFSFSMANHVVTFNNTTTGANFDSWLWTFGNGDSSTVWNPVHTFCAGGYFDICLTLYDSCGWVQYCEDSVMVRDTIFPVIACPGDTSFLLQTGVCDIEFSYPVPVGTDNCPDAVTTLTGLGSGSYFPVGENVELYEVVDLSGNVASCSFTVSVTEDIAPVVICPPHVITAEEEGLNGSTVDYPLPLTSDNCSGQPVPVFATGLPPGAFFPVGLTEVVYEASDNMGNSSTCSFTVTVTPLCGQPHTLTASDIGATMATVTWTAPTTVPEFQLAYRPVGAPLFKVVNTSNAYVVLSNLEPATLYEFKVKDRCNSPASVYGFSALSNFTTLAPYCSQPFNLATEVDGNSVDFSWSVDGYVPSLQLAYRPFGSFVPWTTKLVSGTSFAASGLDGETTYEWKIKDLCNGGSQFGFTSVKYFTTGPATCAQPANLHALNVNTTFATLSWTVNAPVTQFMVAYRPVNSGQNWRTKILSNTNVVITNLLDSTEYEWKVKDRCNAPLSQYGWTTPEYFTTLSLNCSKPTNLMSNVTSSTSVDLSWTTTQPVDDIQVVYRVLGGPWKSNATLTNNMTLNDLMPGSTYEWKARDRCNFPALPPSIFGWSPIEMFSTPVSKSVSAEGSQNMMSVYPNPFKDQINLEWKEEFEHGQVIISVLDVMGREMQNQTINTQNGLNTYSLDLSSLNSGVYLLKVVSERHSEVFRLEKSSQ